MDKTEKDPLDKTVEWLADMLRKHGLVREDRQNVVPFKRRGE